MARFLHRTHCFTRFHEERMFLALAWFSGLVLALLLFSGNADVLSVLTTAADSQIFFWSLLLNMMLPLLLSAFAVFFWGLHSILVLCFCKALTYGSVAVGVFNAFPSSGWLIRWMLLFSSTLCNFLNYYFWLGCFHRPGILPWRRLLVCAALMVLAVFLDCHYVAPLLRLSLV